MAAFSRRISTLAAALLLSVSCRSGKTVFPHAPVILISIDTLRADHLPDYGYGGVETPNLRALRKDSILYENAYSQAPLTLPSHAALLTGLPPYQNGVRDNTGFRLAPSRETLASLLKSQGYATGGSISSYLLRGETGISTGFDFYDDELERNAVERPGMVSETKIEQWIESESSARRPVFAFLHLYEPHTPYAPPEPFRTRYADRLYDGEIAASDAIVGRLLNFLKRKNLYDPAIVIVLSDHGEGLGDHGEEEHSVLLYREDIRVPLFLKLPGSRMAGKMIRTPVALTDVFPTVVSLVGLEVPGGVGGINLVHAGEMRGDAERRIYSETLYPRLHLGWSDLASLTDIRYQYIEAPRPELYDLSSDPGEKRDLSAGRPPAFRTMRLELQKMDRPFAAPQASSPEELKKLASLGYVSVTTSGVEGKNLPDPKDRIEALHDYTKLFALFFAKNDEAVIPLARRLLAKEPKIISAWSMLATSLGRTGNHGEALRTLEEGIREVGQSGVGEEISQAYEQLASMLDQRGDRAGAERVLREAMRRNLGTEAAKRDLARILTGSGRSSEALTLLRSLADSHDTETLDALGVSLAEAGQLAEARGAFLQALKVESSNADVLSHLGTLSLREKDPAAARDWFEKALEKNPKLPGTLTSLGTAFVQLGDDQRALASWKKALDLDAEQYDALFNLAVLTGRHRRFGEARQYLERFVATAPHDRYSEEVTEARRLLRGLRVKS
jgi:arylsulfatase A-like enzyme/Flp pilus assembly protein TadD